VPTYNEERIIAKKIQNIEELDYPLDKIEVIFVDGHSSDRTPDIIKNYIAKCKKSVKLITQETRKGYTCGVIEGILNSNGEIIVLTDAAAYYYPDALKQLVKHFGSHNVGAVTGKEIVFGDNGQIGPELEKSYRFLYDFMREAETEMDSTPDSKGEILAIKRGICDNLVARLQLSLNASFDSCVPYQAKLMGYRTVYASEAKYYEYAPASFVDRMRQQMRRGTILVGALLLFWKMLLNRRYGKFGSIILPAHFIMQCFLPWLFLLGSGCLLILTVIAPMKTVVLWTIVIVALMTSKRSRFFLISFIQSQVALVIAFFKLARRRESFFIDTILSTRK
jgi:glycosyltransferase involved in cell wall biosynthesis